MQPMPKEYNFAEIERKWQSKWEDMGIYHYDWNDKQRVPFSIDTPPPYPSGELHMGNVLNWTYFDMVARYKRMQGYNVLFPQGWDSVPASWAENLDHVPQLVGDTGVRRAGTAYIISSMRGLLRRANEEVG